MSKRLEQIKQVVESKANELSSSYQAFVLGANWADENPKYPWHWVSENDFPVTETEEDICSTGIREYVVR